MAFTFFFRDIHTLDLAIKTITAVITGQSRIRNLKPLSGEKQLFKAVTTN